MLLAAQTVIEVISIDKASQFGSGPNLLLFVLIVVTTVMLVIGIGRSREAVDLALFRSTWTGQPEQSRDALADGLSTATIANAKKVRSRERTFFGLVVMSVGAVGWAIW